MDSLLSRISTAAKVLATGRTGRIDMDVISKQLDAAINSGTLSTGDMVSKQAGASRLDIYNSDTDKNYYAMYGFMNDWVSRNVKQLKKLDIDTMDPADPMRDQILSEMWKQEPILAGAIYSMVAKMISLRWTITGKRRNAVIAAKMLSRTTHMGGSDWGGFISSTAEDFYTTNRGVFWELAKDGDPQFSRATDMAHIDSLCCTMTGNSKYPMVYNGYHTGQRIRFQPGEFAHFTSMPSPREKYLGVGFCAANRAYKAARLLMGLHDYDMEKLNNLPPEGVAAVTGLTMDEFLDALKLWKAQRQRDNSLTFPQVLWLLSSQPNAAVGVNFTGFSQLPESFSRKDVVDQYVNTLAVAFGIDAREIWTLQSGGLGSAGESEIQHLKAKGKGPGEFISTTERTINNEMPEETDFKFDTQDIEEDANAAAVAKAWVDAFLPLYNLPQAGKEPNGASSKTTNPAEAAKENNRPDKPNGAPSLPTPQLPGVNTGGNMASQSGGQNKQAEQVIDKKQFMRLLADKGVLPDWMVDDERVVIADTETRNKDFASEGSQDDYTQIVWERGILKEERLPPIVLYSKEITDADDGSDPAPYAIILNAKMLPTASANSSADKENDNADQTLDETLQVLRELKTQILEENRAIHGEPIPESEAVRGSRVTSKTIKDELELWANDPILSKYLNDDSTIQDIYRTLNNA